MTTEMKSVLVALVLLFTCGQSAPLVAQTGGGRYAALSVGSYGVVADTVKDTRPALGGAVGLAITPWLDAELELVRPTSTFTREYEGTSTSFAGPGASRAEIERLSVITRFRYERRVRVSVSGVAIFHPRRRGRWSPGFIVGLTPAAVRERYSTAPIRIPAGVDPSRASIQPTEQRVLRTRGGLTMGGRLTFAVTPHLLLGPDVRLDYGSIGDEIDNVIRTSVKVIWRF